MSKLWRSAGVALCALLATLVIPLEPVSAVSDITDAITGKNDAEVKPLPSEEPVKLRPETPAGDFTNPPDFDGTPLEKSFYPGLTKRPAPGATPAPGTPDPNQSMKSVVANSPLIGRSDKSNTYLTVDGSKIEEIHSRTVNARDDFGRWREINTKLVPNGARVNTVFTEVDASFATRLDGSEVLKLEEAGATLAMSPLNAKKGVIGKVENNTITYPGALNGADLSYEVSTSRVKERITLDQAPTSAPVYRFNLATKGLTKTQELDGSIVLQAQDGPAFRIPQGISVDAAGSISPVKVTLDGEILSVIPDPKWLSAADRQFPVIVDPDVLYVARSKALSSDAFVGSAYPDTTFNGQSQVVANAYSMRSGVQAGIDWNAYLKFDFSALADKEIRDARLEVMVYEVGGPGHSTEVWPLAQPWSHDTVTWRNRPNHMGFGEWMSEVPVNNWSKLNATEWVKNWVNGAWPNHGMTFNAGGYQEYIRFGAVEQDWMNNDPVMFVTYDDRPTAPVITAPVHEQQIMTTTPQLTATSSTDPNGDPIKYWVRLSDGSHPELGGQVNSGWITSPNFTVPAGSLKDGVTYKWYILAASFEGGTVWESGRWSEVRSFKVNLRLGDQTASPDDAAGPVTVNLTNGNVYTSTSSPTFPTVGGSIGLSYNYNSQAQPTQGLMGKYYPGCVGTDATGAHRPVTQPYLVRLDPQVDFSWGYGSTDPSIDPDNFCSEWEGTITAPTAGTYFFDAASDDGVRIWVNGELIIDRWYDHASTTPPFNNNKQVPLSGPASIRIQHYEAGGGSHLQLWTSDPYGKRFVVPASWLSPGPQVLPQGWAMSADADADLSYVKARINTASVVLVDASGATKEFKRADPNNKASGFLPPLDDKSIVVAMSDGTYQVTGQDGLLYSFDVSGNLQWVRSATDARKPAAARYQYEIVHGAARLQRIEDPVSGRAVVLTYSEFSNCPGGTGFDSQAPTGMLCKVTYWDGTVTTFHYLNRQLARIVDPGNERTDFGYANAMLRTVRDPMQMDWVASKAGTTTPTGGALTHINYSGNRASSVIFSDPIGASTDVATGTTKRPFTSYAYTSATESRVTVGGMGLAQGHARRVLYNSAGQTTNEFDAAGLEVRNEWDKGDRLLKTLNVATGRQATTFYDERGLVTDSYGPGPSSCFVNDPANAQYRRPTSTCAATVPHTSTSYDDNIRGLSVAWWENRDLVGPATTYSTGFRQEDSDPALATNFGLNAPKQLPNKADDFSFRATGSINLSAVGRYDFTAAADDGVRLWIDDQLVIDGWSFTAARTGVFNNPKAGWHRIRLEYFEAGGGALVELWMSGPSQARAVVGSSQVRPDYGLATRSRTADSSGASPAKVSTTSYSGGGLDPVYGLATSTTEDPGGLNLRTEMTYEAPGTGFLRQRTRKLPAGNSYRTDYYGATETRTNHCNGVTGINQAGMPKAKVYPTAADGTTRVDNFIYDSAGRPVCTWTNSDKSTSTKYDSRGRMIERWMPETKNSSGVVVTPARTVTWNHSVSGNPLINEVRDSAGVIRTEVDLLGRVVRYTDVWNRPTTYHYDQAGRQIRSSSWGDVRATVYDNKGRVAQQQIGHDLTSLKTAAIPTYNAAGEIDKITYPDTAAGGNANGTSVTLGRDSLGRANKVAYAKGTTAIATDEVTHSQSGEIIDQKVDGIDPFTTGANYTYDKAGRLTKAYVNGAVFDYNFGTPAGCGTSASTTANRNTNRTSYSLNGVVKATYCYDKADRLISTTDTAFSSGISYDSHGNTTKLGGSTMVYDSADRHLKTTAANGEVVTYVRDALDRIVSRTGGGQTVRYSYSTGSDSPELVLAPGTDNRSLDKTVVLLGGVMKNTNFVPATSTTPEKWTERYSYPSIHGDVIAIADGAGTKQGATRHYDPYGTPLNTVVDNLTGKFDYGWLGSKQRGTETQGGLNVIEMGARQYVPALGRFLEVDPVEGGSANDYDYVNGDPINAFDLDGLFPWVPVLIIGGSVAARFLAKRGLTSSAKHFNRAKQAGARTAGLSPGQLRNFNRYKKKLPAGAQQPTIRRLRNGSVKFSSRVPGRVPKSYAIYTKIVDRTGKTVSYTKTTVDPKGAIVHTKDKMNR